MSVALSLNSDDRVLVLAPHPDDEVIACGGIVQKALEMGIPLRIVFFTYGDNNEWSFMLYRDRPVVTPKAVEAMGRVRHDEAYAADGELKVPGKDLVFLGYPDFRTLSIWSSHWHDSPPASGMLTRARKVPYESALRPGAPYKGEEIVRDLKDVFREFKPTKIFTSHAGDHNPDHLSLYLFTRVALWDMEEELSVELFPYLVHYKRWPSPQGLHAGEIMEPPMHLKQEVSWLFNDLTPDVTGRKESALRKYTSQFRYSSEYLLSFVRGNELFGDFPEIDLAGSSDTMSLSGDRKMFLESVREEFLEESRARFVGLEEHYIGREDDRIIIDLRLSRAFGEAVGVSIYLFGYKKGCPFAEMPKIHIRFGAVWHRVYDQSRIVEDSGVTIDRQSKHVTVRVPLGILQSPERLMTGTRIYLGEMSLDAAPWRMVKLRA